MNYLKMILVVLLLAFASAAMASTITIPGGCDPYGGYCVGPRNVTLTGDLNGVFSAYCDDILNQVQAWDTWNIEINNMDAVGVSHSRFGAPLSKYQQAAYLGRLFNQPGYSNGDIHYAIWNLFAPTQAPDTAGSNLLLLLAAANYQNSNYDNMKILTPVVAPGSVILYGQEYILGEGVPEPASLVLVLLGLSLIGAGYVRRC